MIEQEWMQFENTGRVDDYLAYSRGRGTGYDRTDTGCDRKEREAGDGADHCAYRYGVGGDTNRGL